MLKVLDGSGFQETVYVKRNTCTGLAIISHGKLKKALYVDIWLSYAEAVSYKCHLHM